MSEKHRRQSVDVDGLMFLAAGLGGDSTDETVERMGKSSQGAFCHDDSLPRDMAPRLRGTEYNRQSEEGVPKERRTEFMNAREILDTWGVKFPEEDDGDKLFISCKFPEGWRKERTDHYMWSDLLDDKGQKRAEIFYKPEFYDQKAHMHLCRRYVVRRKLYRPEVPYAQAQVETSNGEAVFTNSTHFFWQTTSKAYNEELLKQYEEEGAARKKAADECYAWLEENFPLWRTYLNYWD